MRGVFDDEEFEQVKPGRDTELTLGAGTLLLLFFGLVLVCGLCFGLGYAVGHRGDQPSASSRQLPGTGSQASSQAAGSVPKPSATAAPAVPQPAPASPASAPSQPGSSEPPQSAAAVAIPVGTPQAASSSAPDASSNGQLQVRPALPAASSAQPSASAASAVPVHPALQPPAVQLMVQIAAVSHVEDAKVLSDALRKRGYAVTARREPADDLIHVRIGPFGTRDEANRWRMKLLNDGYNAMIQP